MFKVVLILNVFHFFDYLASANLLNAPEMNVNNIEPNKALQKPVTEKPGTNHAAKPNIAALITKVNNPSVKIDMGSVNSSIIGLTKILTSPIMMVAIIATPKPLIAIPGKI